MSSPARSICTERRAAAALAACSAPCRVLANASSFDRSQRHVRNGACGRYRAIASARSSRVSREADRSRVCAFFTSIRPVVRARITEGWSAPDSPRTTTSDASVPVTASSPVTCATSELCASGPVSRLARSATVRACRPAAQDCRRPHAIIRSPRASSGSSANSSASGSVASATTCASLRPIALVSAERRDSTGHSATGTASDGQCGLSSSSSSLTSSAKASSSRST